MCLHTAMDSAHVLLEVYAAKRGLWQLISQRAYWQITPAANVRNHLRRTRWWICARQSGHSSIGASHTEHVHRCPHGRNIMSHWKLGRKMFKKSCSNLSLQHLGKKRFWDIWQRMEWSYHAIVCLGKHENMHGQMHDTFLNHSLYCILFEHFLPNLPSTNVIIY